MKTKILIIGLAALLTAGCLTSASKINAVQIGMTKEQVLKIMGQPASITADTNAVYLNYVLKDAPATFGVQAVVSPYEIKLVDDKVVFYGRAGYPNSPNPAPMPIIMPMAH